MKTYCRWKNWLGRIPSETISIFESIILVDRFFLKPIDFRRVRFFKTWLLGILGGKTCFDGKKSWKTTIKTCCFFCFSFFFGLGASAGFPPKNPNRGISGYPPFPAPRNKGLFIIPLLRSYFSKGKVGYPWVLSTRDIYQHMPHIYIYMGYIYIYWFYGAIWCNVMGTIARVPSQKYPKCPFEFSWGKGGIWRVSIRSTPHPVTVTNEGL